LEIVASLAADRPTKKAANPLRKSRIHSRVSGEGGTRTTAENTGKTSDSQPGGAKSGAVDGPTWQLDAGLAQIVAAWPHLLEPIRRAMLALVADY